ncbi:unnamed protein product [Ectocarpus sp. 12 AP-2014]
MSATRVMLVRCTLSMLLGAHAFVVPQPPCMISASDPQYRPVGLEKIGKPSPPFATFISSSSSVDATFRDLARIVTAEVGDSMEQQHHHHHHHHQRCAMAVVYFSREDEASVQDPMCHVQHDDAGEIESALARLHDSLPFVDDVIASPARAASVSQKNEEQGARNEEPAAAVTATLALFHNPGLDARPFVLHPARELGLHGDRLLQEDEIGAFVGESLETSASRHSGGEEVSHGVEAGGSSGPRGHHRTMCLAFSGGGGGAVESEPSDLCTSTLHRLNGILGDAGRRESEAGSSSSSSRCPLVSTVVAAGYPAYASVRDPGSRKRVTVAAEAVGAILTCLPDSEASLHLVHAGNDIALRGSQFRVASVSGGDIAEVVPVESKQTEAATAVPTLDGGFAGGCGAGAGDSLWQRPRWPCGVISAAEWCKQVVSASTRFEKLAMQSALGVGVLERAGPREGAAALGQAGGAPAGVARNLPAHGCLSVTEVKADESISLAHGGRGEQDDRRRGDGGSATAECGVRLGDLCDIRAIGVMAAMQAEQDAYSWLRIARLSALIQGATGDREASSATVAAAPVFQGCLTAGTRARCAPGAEAESCEELVRVAAGHGSLCPTAGMVGDAQLVSVDNVMMTCSHDVGMSSVYVCGSAGEQESSAASFV